MASALSSCSAAASVAGASTGSPGRSLRIAAAASCSRSSLCRPANLAAALQPACFNPSTKTLE